MNDTANVRRTNQLANQWIFDRLKLYFATLTVLCGFILAVGNDGEVIPIIAVFFAIIGYVCVDVLKLFALPPTAAYIAMALAAAFCIADFTDGDATGPRQLLAVSHLLVIVQAILMMQRKSKRIFEQLAIFCLLELIVAAVFNHALSFGLLLIPIGIIGALALGLLATVSTVKGFTPEDKADPSGEVTTLGSSSIRIEAGESTRVAAKLANQYAKVSTLVLAPSIILIALVFFYALPRTSEAARNIRRGDALIGFSDQVRLEQLGHMLRNPEIALQIDLADRVTGKSYRVFGGIYLRGRTLEQYETRKIGSRTTATWNAVPINPKTEFLALPREYFPRRATDTNFYDTVNVTVACESMRSNSLFAIAPYHRRNQSPEIVHVADRWTIRRRSTSEWVRPPIEYSFGTNAFRNGIQTELIARLPTADSSNRPKTRQNKSTGSNEEKSLPVASQPYRDKLLDFDSQAMPTIANIAQSLTLNRSGKRRTDYKIAKVIEQHFASGGLYRYSLDLRSESVAGLDPIEQFIAVDQQGHCQYFASAMAMMLRSQEIPARVVVGYHTDEYNEWANQYIARQLHAHAWVEALVDSDQIGPLTDPYGQPSAEQYWLRLDPTPSENISEQNPGTIQQSIDLAQDLWDDYVVDMDVDRQQGSFLTGGIQRSVPWYDDAVGWLSGQIRRIQAGDLGGGSLAREFFSWPAAIVGTSIFVAIMLLIRIRIPKRIGRRRANEIDYPLQQPTIQFYAAALDQLARVGIHRHNAQTPIEFAAAAAAEIAQSQAPSIEGPMERLTETFYRHRFGGTSQLDYDGQFADIEADLASVKASVDAMMLARAE